MSYATISAPPAHRYGDEIAISFMDRHEDGNALSPVRGMLISCLLGAMGWTAILAPFII